MKVDGAALSGGVLGVLGTLCLFLAFATDYWLVSSDNCGLTEMLIMTQDENGTVGTNLLTVEDNMMDSDLLKNRHWDMLNTGRQVKITESVPVSPSSLTLHHEGFFWRCAFQVELSAEPHLATLFTNQPESKVCIHGYLFPLPVAIGPVPHPEYDGTAVFRGFWTVLIILALLCALIGGFLLVCGVPFYSHKLYRVGGALLIAAACLFLFVLLLYVMWMELVDVKRYILQEKGDLCPEADVQIHYGLSFMVAGAAVPLVLTSGMVFMCVARALTGDKV